MANIDLTFSTFEHAGENDCAYFGRILAAHFLVCLVGCFNFLDDFFHSFVSEVSGVESFFEFFEGDGVELTSRKDTVKGFLEGRCLTLETVFELFKESAHVCIYSIRRATKRAIDLVFHLIENAVNEAL